MMRALGKYPLTFLGIALSLLGLLVVASGSLELVYLFSLQEISGSEYWRLVTPAFLHFDLIHLGGNMAFFWFLGSQVERQDGKLLFLLNFLVLAVAANVAQLLVVPEHLFGGMSGVNFGLLSYCMLSNRISPRPVFLFPPGLFWFSVVMLLVGFSGIFSLFGYDIANWAHLGGFLSGFLTAIVIRHLTRFYRG
jgi:GlpG protein